MATGWRAVAGAALVAVAVGCGPLPAGGGDGAAAEERSPKLVAYPDFATGPLEGQERIEALEEDGLEVTAGYEVGDGELEDVVGDEPSGDDAALAADTWARVRELLPADLLDPVTLFVLYDADGETLGFTSQDPALTGFVFALDADEDDPVEFDDTILHEFVHVLTLDDDQFDVGEDDCAYPPGGGCYDEDAYLQAWVDRFWSDLLDDLEEADDPLQAAEDIYDLDEDRFIREYAATNPDEDLAETFASWARDVEPETPALEEKFAFFQDYDVFIEIRDRVRTAS